MPSETFGMYTVREVAAILKTHPRTVLNYIQRGQLSAMKINVNGHYRISDDDLKKFIAARYGSDES